MNLTKAHQWRETQQLLELHERTAMRQLLAEEATSRRAREAEAERSRALALLRGCVARVSRLFPVTIGFRNYSFSNQSIVTSKVQVLEGESLSRPIEMLAEPLAELADLAFVKQLVGL